MIVWGIFRDLKIVCMFIYQAHQQYLKGMFCQNRNPYQASADTALQRCSYEKVKKCSENMQQIYRRSPMPKWDFNKVARQIY